MNIQNYKKTHINSKVVWSKYYMFLKLKVLILRHFWRFVWVNTCVFIPGMGLPGHPSQINRADIQTNLFTITRMPNIFADFLLASTCRFFLPESKIISLCMTRFYVFLKDSCLDKSVCDIFLAPKHKFWICPKMYKKIIIFLFKVSLNFQFDFKQF